MRSAFRFLFAPAVGIGDRRAFRPGARAVPPVGIAGSFSFWTRPRGARKSGCFPGRTKSTCHFPIRLEAACPQECGTAHTTRAECRVGPIACVARAPAGPGAESAAREDRAGALAYAPEAFAGPAVPALRSGAPILIRAVNAGPSGTAAARGPAGEGAGPRRPAPARAARSPTPSQRHARKTRARRPPAGRGGTTGRAWGARSARPGAPRGPSLGRAGSWRRFPRPARTAARGRRRSKRRAGRLNPGAGGQIHDAAGRRRAPVPAFAGRRAGPDSFRSGIAPAFPAADAPGAVVQTGARVRPQTGGGTAFGTMRLGGAPATLPGLAAPRTPGNAPPPAARMPRAGIGGGVASGRAGPPGGDAARRRAKPTRELWGTVRSCRWGRGPAAARGAARVAARRPGPCPTRRKPGRRTVRGGPPSGRRPRYDLFYSMECGGRAPRRRSPPASNRRTAARTRTRRPKTPRGPGTRRQELPPIRRPSNRDVRPDQGAGGGARPRGCTLVRRRTRCFRRIRVRRARPRGRSASPTPTAHGCRRAACGGRALPFAGLRLSGCPANGVRRPAAVARSGGLGSIAGENAAGPESAKPNVATPRFLRTSPGRRFAGSLFTASPNGGPAATAFPSRTSATSSAIWRFFGSARRSAASSGVSSNANRRRPLHAASRALDPQPRRAFPVRPASPGARPSQSTPSRPRSAAVPFSRPSLPRCGGSAWTRRSRGRRGRSSRTSRTTRSRRGGFGPRRPQTLRAYTAAWAPRQPTQNRLWRDPGNTARASAGCAGIRGLCRTTATCARSFGTGAGRRSRPRRSRLYPWGAAPDRARLPRARFPRPGFKDRIPVRGSATPDAVPLRVRNRAGGAAIRPGARACAAREASKGGAGARRRNGGARRVRGGTSRSAAWRRRAQPRGGRARPRTSRRGRLARGRPRPALPVRRAAPQRKRRSQNPAAPPPPFPTAADIARARARRGGRPSRPWRRPPGTRGGAARSLRVSRAQQSGRPRASQKRGRARSGAARLRAPCPPHAAARRLPPTRPPLRPPPTLRPLPGAARVRRRIRPRRAGRRGRRPRARRGRPRRNAAPAVPCRARRNTRQKTLRPPRVRPPRHAVQPPRRYAATRRPRAGQRRATRQTRPQFPAVSHAPPRASRRRRPRDCALVSMRRYHLVFKGTTPRTVFHNSRSPRRAAGAAGRTAAGGPPATTPRVERRAQRPQVEADRPGRRPSPNRGAPAPARGAARRDGKTCTTPPRRGNAAKRGGPGGPCPKPGDPYE